MISSNFLIMIDDSFLTGSKMEIKGEIAFSGGFSIFFEEEVDKSKLENGIEIEKNSNIMPNIQTAPRNPMPTTIMCIDMVGSDS